MAHFNLFRPQSVPSDTPAARGPGPVLGVDPAQQAGASAPPAHGPRGLPSPPRGRRHLLRLEEQAAGRGPCGARLAGLRPAIPARPTQSRGHPPLRPAPRPPLTVGRKPPGFHSHFLRAPQRGGRGWRRPPRRGGRGRLRSQWREEVGHRDAGVDAPPAPRVAPGAAGGRRSPAQAPPLPCAAPWPSPRAKAGSVGGAGPVGHPAPSFCGRKGEHPDAGAAPLLSRQTAFPESRIPSRPTEPNSSAPGQFQPQRTQRAHLPTELQGKGSDK